MAKAKVKKVAKKAKVRAAPVPVAVTAKATAVSHAAVIQSVKDHIEALRKAAAAGTILKAADLDALATIAATL